MELGSDAKSREAGGTAQGAIEARIVVRAKEAARRIAVTLHRSTDRAGRTGRIGARFETRGGEFAADNTSLQERRRNSPGCRGRTDSIRNGQRCLPGRRGALSSRSRQPSNPYRSPAPAMILRPRRTASGKKAVRMVLIPAAALAIFGCAKKEAEVEPVVSVQVQPVKRAAISEIVSADAVVFPVEQAVITPKITSTIRSFEVQRGSRVRKGQLLAVLENADLAAAADQSK